MVDVVRGLWIQIADGVVADSREMHDCIETLKVFGLDVANILTDRRDI